MQRFKAGVHEPPPTASTDSLVQSEGAGPQPQPTAEQFPTVLASENTPQKPHVLDPKN